MNNNYSDIILGIDLGTTNSAAAVYKDNGIVIIKSKDNKMLLKL